MVDVNATHDPKRRSWIDSANAPDTDFPVQNLPFGVFSAPGRDARVGVAIGDQIFDLREALGAGLFSGQAEVAAKAAAGSVLNSLMAVGQGPCSALRERLADLLRVGGPDAEAVKANAGALLVSQSDAELHLPAEIGAYTDFSCSYDHMSRLGPSGKPPEPFFYVPIGYNGRASSVRPSGADIQRPMGQFREDGGAIAYGPEPRLDFELEFAAFVAGGNALGSALSVAEAERSVFGYCLLNDWSARGIQFFESVLGPFLGKSFGTTISPWIVTAEALAPFRTSARPRADDEPPIPSHLLDPSDQAEGGLGVELTAYLRTAAMAKNGDAPLKIVTTNFKYMYWTMSQMLAHHTSNGCNLAAGDLLGSGTVSGPEPSSRACLAEINERGANPVKLPSGETRIWLKDGDELSMRGRAARDGFVPIGFGECIGQVTPAAA
jgi:fumarylacetoacetase